jgi:hypothetical protein
MTFDGPIDAMATAQTIWAVPDCSRYGKLDPSRTKITSLSKHCKLQLTLKLTFHPSQYNSTSPPWKTSPMPVYIFYKYCDKYGVYFGGK